MEISFSEFLNSLSEQTLESMSDDDKKTLKNVFEFGAKAHLGQLRASGQAYFYAHCVPVAQRISSLGYEWQVVAAGLLHDTIEDTKVTEKDISEKFSSDIADLVQGVSKLGKLKYKGSDRHVESLRKFFLAIAKDSRVVVIKLCDRWHNLETLHFLPKEKQQRIAQESIMIHAQLASRLGIGQLVTTINDLAFPFAYPEEYQRTKKLLESRLKDEKETITKIYRNLLAELTPELGYKPKIDKRVKGLYSLYQKLVRKDWNIDEVFDLIAIRVIVKKVSDCYSALGIIHSHWKPVPGRVKDYIALPKPNGYQSLHTVIFSGNGPRVEIQIRTEDMHLFNEYGIASHHLYKNEQHNSATEHTKEWFKQLGEFQANKSNENYLEELASNFFSTRIFVLTPEGDVMDMPKGATILDFAYLIHSDIGDSAIGGRMNGQFCALKTPIENEAIVEIVTDKKSKPSDKWLEWVNTNHAKEKIKRNINKQRISL